MVYRIEEVENSYINLTVPYVPYDHFQSSRSYRAGLGYGVYLDLLRSNMIREDRRIFEHKKQLCSREVSKEERHPVWLPSDLSMSVSANCGFLHIVHAEVIDFSLLLISI